ncbi:MAG: hypothetical protein ACYTGH_16335, partial [Planctomycetota bacterium]
MCFTYANDEDDVLPWVGPMATPYPDCYPKYDYVSTWGPPPITGRYVSDFYARMDSYGWSKEFISCPETWIPDEILNGVLYDGYRGDLPGDVRWWSYAY